MSDQFFVRGQILDEDRFGLEGVRVDLGGQGRHGFLTLGSGTTDAEGWFYVAASPGALDNAPSLSSFRLGLRRSGRSLVVKSGITRWAASTPPSKIEIVVAKAYTGESLPDWTFSGRVRHGDGAAVSGVTVSLYHRKIGADVALATGLAVDSGGGFTTTLQSVPHDPLMLYAVALDGQTEVGRSPVVPHASQRETLDIIVVDATLRSPSELVRVQAAVDPHLVGVQLDTLTVEDVRLLSAELLDFSPMTLAAYIAAKRLVGDTVLSAQGVTLGTLYALVRHGLPSHVSALLSASEDAWRKALERASAENRVGSSETPSSVEMPSVAAVLTLRKACIKEKAASADTPRSIGGLLSTVDGLEPADIQAIVSQYQEVVESDPQQPQTLEGFWAWVDATYSASLALALRDTLRKGVIVMNHLPMVEALAGVAPEDLALYDETAWLNKIDTQIEGTAVGFPPSVDGANGAERRLNYAKMLMQQAEAAYPGRAILANPGGSADLQTFGPNNLDLDLFREPFADPLSAGNYDLTDVQDAAALRIELLELQRLHRASTAFQAREVIASLRTAGFGSSMHIANTSKVQLKAALGGVLEEAEIEDLHKKAQETAGVTVARYFEHVPALQVPMEVLSAHEYGANDVEGYTEMFGSAVYTSTDASRSVLSPAAYYVDLLEWLNERGVLSTLLARRPDLEDVKLTKANTLTTMPYIDLVLELLESQATGSAIPASTSWTAEELELRPEHANVAGYASMSAKIYPFSLPFDLGTEQVRSYLEALGTTREEVLEVYASAPTALALERLGSTSSELGHFLDDVEDPDDPPNAANARQLWGFSKNDPTWLTTLSSVPELLDRAGLELEELLDLVHMRYGGSDQQTGDHLLIDDGGAERDATQWTVKKPGSPPTVPEEGNANRLRHAVRLQRLTGWSFNDLDRVLLARGAAVAGAPLGEGDVQHLGALQSLHELLEVPVWELASWWANLDTAPDRASREEPEVCPYNQVFTSRSIDTPAAFVLNGHEVSGPGALTDAMRQHIQGSLGITSSDLSVLEDKLSITTLSVANLSVLHRYASLAHAVGRSVQEVLLLVDNEQGSLAAKPFATPSEALDFIEVVAELGRLGTTGWNVEWWLTPGTSDNAARPSDATVQSVLGDLRDALKSEHDEELKVVSEKLANALNRTPSSVEALFDDGLTWAVWTGSKENFTGTQFFSAFTALEDTGEEGQRDDLVRTSANEAILDAISCFEALHKAAGVLNAAGVDEAGQAWWLGQLAGSNEWGLLDVLKLGDATELSFEKFMTVLDYGTVQADLPGVEASLPLLLDSAEFTSLLAELTGWNQEDIQEAGGAPSSMVELRQLIDRLLLVERVGVGASDLASWAVTSPDVALASSVQAAARGAASEEEAWAEAAKAARNTLRNRQRDVLVDFLVRKNGHADVEALSADLLVDVQMDACMLTSRLKLAISSVQLFVHRALLGLEGVSFAAEERVRWRWMKNYRVWEAGRKIFLWPENWMDPFLRDDKTPLFQQLETKLRSVDLSEEDADALVLEYLEGLHEVAKLRILAVTYARGPDTYYVFGRTRSENPTFYMRRRETGRGWLPWEKVDVGVEGNHLVPVEHNGRLNLLWATFSPGSEQVLVFKEDEAFEGTPMSGVMLPQSAPVLTWEVTVSWSELGSQGWSPVKTGDSFVIKHWDEPPNDEGNWGTPSEERLPKQFYSFRSERDDEGDLYIHCVRVTSYLEEVTYQTNSFGQGASFSSTTTPGRTEYTVMATLGFDECLGTLEVMETAGTYESEPFEGAELRYMGVCLEDEALVLPQLLRPQTAKDGIKNGVLPSLFDEVLGGAPVLRAGLAKPTLYLPPSSPIWLGDTPLLVQYGARTYVVDVLYPGVRDEDLADNSLSLSNPGNRFATAAEKTLTSGTAWPSPLPATAHTYGRSAMVLTSVQDAGLAVHQMLDRVGQEEEDPLQQIATSDQAYRFSSFYYPYACTLIETVRRKGVFGLLSPEEEPQDDVEKRTEPSYARQQLQDDDFVETFSPSPVVVDPLPVREFDFGYGSAYGAYNWEVFFHLPFTIATHLSQQGRYEEARTWFHTIFDPTDTNTNFGEGSLRFWKIKPFLQPPSSTLDEWAAVQGGSARTWSQRDTQLTYERQIQSWMDDPFNPHAIARMRYGTYQRRVVMSYLDNLVAWGDDLFREDSIESLNEAAMLYVEAANLLGARPEEVPPAAAPAAHSYAELLADPSLAPQSAGLARVENGAFRPQLAIPEDASYGPLPLTGMALYFDLPANEVLLGYWDKVADRLYKIRHCMNLDGQVRMLALYQPPLDPGMLVTASASGLLASAMGDKDQARTPYRYAVVLQKALALTGTVRSLGGALLAALEKGDAEELSRLRVTQEQALNDAVRDHLVLQAENAELAMLSLEKSKAIVEHQLEHVGDKLDALDAVVSGVGTLGGLAMGAKGGFRDLDSPEFLEKLQDKRLIADREKQMQVGGLKKLAATVGLIPQITVGVSAGTETGGTQLSRQLDRTADVLQTLGRYANLAAQSAGIYAQLGHRKRQYKQQRAQLELELERLDLQLESAAKSLEVRQGELETHDLRVEHAKAHETFLRTKFSNQELYHWMAQELSGLYFESYRLAYDMAKKAQASFNWERGHFASESKSYVKYGHWDSLRKGLLAGERLQLDLERMDAAYITENERDIELTKRISLALLDYDELQTLRETGACELHVPYELLDEDFPGLYLRRIKGVSLSIPCVESPYAEITAKLTLQASACRTSADKASLVLNSSPLPPVFTSSGRDASGVFRFDFNDARYLPFEGYGAKSDWSLELMTPDTYRDYDLQSIADVVLTLHYTARDGTATTTYVDAVKLDLASRARLFGVSASQDDPDAWLQFTNEAPHVLTLDLADALPGGLASTKEISGFKVILVPEEATTASVTASWTLGSASSSTDLVLPAGDFPTASHTFASGEEDPSTFELTITGGWVDLRDVLVIFTYTATADS